MADEFLSLRVPLKLVEDDSGSGGDDIEDSPGEEGSIVYCTVPDSDGSYDIDLTWSDGTLLTTFGKICIQYQETVDDTNEIGETWRRISSRMSITQTHTIVESSGAGTGAKDLSFATEFFLKSSPSSSLVLFHIGKVLRTCRTPEFYRVTHEHDLGNQPEVLPQAAPFAYLHYSFYRGRNCP